MFPLKPGEHNMTAAQVRADEQTIAAYVVTARRMANGTRTDWRGRNGGRIERRPEAVTEEHDAVQAPGEVAERD